jgi:hypothetical protein
MPDPATTRQKQFLRQLGYKDAAKVTKQQASQLIDKLLAEEKASGKTFPCPYCKAKFGPRPKREKKCPSCGNRIIQLSGKFYTLSQADTLFQADWLKEARQFTKQEVSDDWKEERKYRKEFGEPLIVGYSVTAGPSCPHVKHLEKLLILIEDAYDAPDMLPPFDECKHDTCECQFISVMADEAKKGTRVAEFSDPAVQAKLTTRKKSLVGNQTRKKSSGCAFVLIACLLLLIVIFALHRM